MRSVVASAFASVVFLASTSALADPGWFAPPSAEPTPLPASAAPATSAASTPPAAPKAASTTTGAGCALDRHAGVADDDAETVEQIVCGEVRESLPQDRHWRVRVSKLGGKVVLTLAATTDEGATLGDEKRLVLSTLDEVPVAAPRLVEAARATKPVAETADATNIVGLEARVPKKKSSEVHALLSIVGVTALAPVAATGAGAEVGLSAGSETWAFLGDLRVAGGDATQVALSGGARYYTSTRDFSPFIGLGMAVEEVSVKKTSGGGLAFYGELGMDVLRTHQFGGAAALRFDAPTFSISPGSGSSGPHFYTPVLAATFSMRF